LLLQFLEDPKPWEDMSMQEKSWFWPGSNVTGTDFSGCAHSAADDLPCCKLEPPADLTFSVRSNEKGATSQQVCECWGADWDRSIYQRFDNTWVALGAFYEISTTEGWIDVMLAAVDATDIDMQPVENNNEGWILFFIIFMIVGSFLMTNLFVGVIIQNFNDLKAEKDKEQAIANAGDTSELLMTEDQRMWAMTQRLLAKMIESNMAKPMEPENKIRKFCFQVSEADGRDNLVGFVAMPPRLPYSLSNLLSNAAYDASS
jgi:voltage-dependent calcium channel L type alpha-1D